MTRNPTAPQVHDLFKAIRHAGAQWMALEQQLNQAISRDRAGTTTPDGYPRSVGGGGRCSTDGSTTEAAAINLTEGNTQRDRHRELTADAARALVVAADALNTLRARLRSIHDLTDDTPPAPRKCDACLGRLQQGRDITRGTVGDRLTEAVDLCGACYDFCRQATSAGSRSGQLPDREAIERRHRTGRWRIRMRT